MSWILLLVAGLLEVVWAIALKHTDGFTRLWPTALACSTALVSFVLLSLAIRDLPVGTAYAVWVGIGTVGVASIGIVSFGESPTPARLVFIVFIAVGIAGLKAVEG
jgi:quaternary ammonium compound-resistance protein SugE